MKKILIVILIVTVVLLIAYYLISQKDILFNSISPAASCAKEGDPIGASSMPKSCCTGLKPAGGWPGGYSGDCTLPPPPSGLSICTNCGDNKCDIHDGENKCNCPGDCNNTNSNNPTQLSEEEKYCLKNGGKVGEIMECGKKVAICTLKDDTDCAIDEYYKGYCQEGVIVEWGEGCRQ